VISKAPTFSLAMAATNWGTSMFQRLMTISKDLYKLKQELPFMPVLKYGGINLMAASLIFGLLVASFMKCAA